MSNVGIIGYGYWGPNLVRNFAESSACRVIEVCDLKNELLAKVSLRYPTIKTSNDYRNIINNPEIDAVVIATPVSTHFDFAIEALRAGKHVLVEKPMTATVEQSKRLIDEANRQNRVLMVDHTFIFTGAVQKIKELVQDEKLGQIYYYDSVRVNLGLFQHDVSVVWDLAVHDLSIMDYVLGAQPTGVSALAVSHIEGQLNNQAYLTCLFDNSLLAHFHTNWLAPVKIRKTLIGGERQMVVYDDLEPSEKVKIYNKGITMNDHPNSKYQQMVEYRTGDMSAPQLNTKEALSEVARHFLDCIDSSSKPITDGHAGLRVVSILEAATKSIKNQGRIVELDSLC